MDHMRMTMDPASYRAEMAVRGRHELQAMHAAGDNVGQRIRREGDSLVVRCPDGGTLKVAGHRLDMAVDIASGRMWKPSMASGKAYTPPPGKTRTGLTTAQVLAVADLIKPVLRPLLVAAAKANTKPAARRVPLSREAALLRISSAIAQASHGLEGQH